ncbi:hypothetical protein BMF94_1741 [Rhodotorula taiwanensis]|uniref:Rho GDP-dissociation inhibitor n=1 Tax=Rhodotorula taiwanensis TaxID=741276 RepID=A0A2S5BED1_9BASI|nr:hypothetical protein BMF94_1741 [Rhodotorula taiwanensis]
MSGHAQEPSSVPDADLAPTETQGYKVGQAKTLDELQRLDAEDESLARWKASLGLGGAAAPTSAGPNVQVLSLSLNSPTRPQPIVLDLTQPDKLAALKKERDEYSVELSFRVNNLVSGLKYIQVVRRMGATVDKLESMIGSYGPAADPVVKRFVSEEAPSGMLARSGTYSVRSRVIDDDGKLYVDFEWAFKLAKDW